MIWSFRDWSEKCSDTVNTRRRDIKQGGRWDREADLNIPQWDEDDKTVTQAFESTISSIWSVSLLAYPVKDHHPWGLKLNATSPCPPCSSFRLWCCCAPVPKLWLHWSRPCCDYLLKCLPSSIDYETIQSSAMSYSLYPRTRFLVNEYSGPQTQWF